MLTQSQLALFTLKNYRFSTKENGRLTSLYFEDSERNQGRYRRDHKEGALLVYQGQSKRLFIHPDEQSNFCFGLESHNRFLPPDQICRFGYRAHGDYKVLSTGKAISNLSLQPIDGWHVLELSPMTFYARHGSSGTVTLKDKTIGDVDFDSLASIQNQVDWTQ